MRIQRVWSSFCLQKLVLQVKTSAENQIERAYAQWVLNSLQTAKWTVEGMVKCHDVKAYVSCRGYVGIPLSVRLKPQIKVAPRIMLIRPWVKHFFALPKDFFI